MTNPPDTDETLEHLRDLEVTSNDLVVRRFMTFDRFHQIVETRSLYLAPASSFVDPLEGRPTHRDINAQQSQLRAWGFGKQELRMAAEANLDVTNWNRQATVVSCWTRNTTDSSRMWTEYAGGKAEAVAIESTVGGLRRALGAGYLVVSVRYIDFRTGEIPRGHSLLPFFYKEFEQFSWEKEVRVVGNMAIGARIGSPRVAPVRLDALVQRITISPTAPSSFAEAVSALVTQELPGVPIEVARLS